MKKILVLPVMLVLVLCIYMAAENDCSIWEIADNTEKVVAGANCWQFSFNSCPGGTTTCESIPCSSTDGGGSWTCPSSGNTVDKKKINGYLNSPTKAESNGWSVYTPVSVYCTLRYTCGTCRLTSDSKYYCANIISSGNDVDAATGATNLNPVSNCNVQSANTCN